MIKTLALVLKKQNLGETDRIVTIFSPSLGKKRVVAKAVRKPLSKLAGHLDTMMVSQLILTDKPELPTVISASLVESFEHLRTNLPELEKAYAVSKITERVIIEDVPQQAIFQLTVDTLVRINQQDPFTIIWLKFLFDLAKLLGLGMTAFHCQKCQKKITGPAHWVELERAFYCQDCPSPGLSFPIEGNSLKMLQLLGRCSYQELTRLVVAEKVEQQVEEILLRVITDWFNKPWQSYRALGGEND
ncbi:MAG TPA: DNA repair protein RecO [Candidatus Saccharimonadales bacterium]|nr:DNA repair protein RecO [Candidatus Saccharimonadales bacterium]